jgi:alpha-1,3-mannosyltransferase
VPINTESLTAPGAFVYPVGSPTKFVSEGVEVGAAPRKPLLPVDSLHAGNCRARFPHLTEAPVPRWRENVFIAANLHNSAGNGVAAAMSAELLRLAYYLAMAVPASEAATASPTRVPDPSNVFISIFESGSSDSTATVLQALGEELKAKNIPAMIVWGGDVAKSEGHHIKNMAKLRNAALRPLYANIRAQRASGGAEGWVADRVVFINDVFFCAEDVLRLLDSGDGGYEHLSRTEREERERADMTMPAPLAHLRGLQPRALGQRPDMVCAVDYKDGTRGIGIYDHWVFRDRYGQRVTQRPHPFFRDTFDQAAFGEGRRSDVFACWGGMVVIDGALFAKHGLTFRWRHEHCSTSECTHFPADVFAALGEKAWIQQDSMAATFYVASVRDAFASHPLYDMKARLAQREAMAARRLTITAEEVRVACADRGIPDVEHASFPPPSPLCPALPYPLAPYADVPVEYPPAHWCCGEYGPVPVHWLNCHQVITMTFSEEQKRAVIAADFSVDLQLYKYAGQPDHIWQFKG